MKNFLLSVFLLVGQVSLAQRIGDYKSVASGDWSSLSTWQRWNGTAWVQPTSSEGYPGQNSVFYGAIVVEAGTVVSIDAIPSGFFTRPMATVTIKGRLVLSGPNNQAGIATFDTQLVDVVVGSGQIEFQNKVSLRINSSLVIGSAVFKVGLGGIIGDCSNNQDIQLGNNTGSDFVSICKGGGSANVTFDELMKAGGTPDVVINPVAPVCSGGTLNLSGAISGPTGTNGTFSWFLNDSSESFASGTTATIPAIAAGTYTIKLIYTATYSLGVYSNSETVTVIIPPTVATPTIGTVTNITCSSGTGSVVLNSLPSGSWMIKQSGALSTTYSGSGSTYTIVGLAQGNYTFSVISGGCTSSTTVNVPIADASSTTWNGSSWSNGVPDETKNAIITEVAPNSPFTSNLIAC
ncbi:MAG: hypothetical protein ACRC6O_07550, partial [Flavobacterium sp.]